METTYWDVITETIADDEAKLKEYVLSKVCEPCEVNGNWLNASIRCGTPGGWTLTPEYISVLVLDKEWEYHPLTNLLTRPYPLVVLFKPPSWKTTFSSVKARDERDMVIWHVYDTPNMPAAGIFAAVVPAGCAVEYLQVDVKHLAPKASLPPDGESIDEASNVNERPDGSGETAPRQVRVGDGESSLQQHRAESYPLIPTDIEDNDGSDTDSIDSCFKEFVNLSGRLE